MFYKIFGLDVTIIVMNYNPAKSSRVKMFILFRVLARCELIVGHKKVILLNVPLERAGQSFNVLEENAETRIDSIQFEK